MTTKGHIDLELRPATMADVGLVADLETARMPDDPRDPEMLRFWWTTNLRDEVWTRMVAERDGAATAYFSAGHARWEEALTRFAWIRLALHPDAWSPTRFEELLALSESWIREEEGHIGVARIREDFKDERRIFEGAGYGVVRRTQPWELDLAANRKRLLAGVEEGRARMAQQGVRILTLDRDTDPDVLAKLYELANRAKLDIPTTVPMQVMSYDEWHHFWFDNPGIRPDRFWIAREGDSIVGLSAIEYPPVRGFPFTAFTGTSPSVRGRGIARALKHETVAQAISLGAKRIRTANDGENAPILHINAGMGYERIEPVLELHRVLSP